MKMNSKYILMLASTAALAAACEVAQIETPEPDVTPVVLAENEIAARLPKVLDLGWTKGDKITVITSSASQEFEILDDYTLSLAKFRGEAIEGEAFSVLYSKAGNTTAAVEARSYEGQEQAASGASDHLNFDMLLSGVSSYKDVTFSKEWAEENGGEFKMSNCIKFDLKFPGQVLTLKNIGLKADKALFFSTNAASSATDSLSLSVPGVDISLKDNEFTAYMLTSWQPLNITDKDQITLWAQYGEKAYRTVLPAQNITLDGGEILEINVEADGWEYYDMNPGSKINPHQIKTKADLKAIASQLIEGEDRYFNLLADIDMAGEDWTPISTDASKYRGMVFEGNGHKISNLTVKSDADFASFAGILMGSMKNVTFENPSVTSNYDAVGSAGVVAAYAGYANGDAEVVMENITVTGASLNVTKSNATPAGILAGQAKNVTVTNCHVKGDVHHAAANAECNIGGFIGKLDGGVITDCSIDGNLEVTSVSRVHGGFIGSIRATSTVTNCTQKGNLKAPGTVRYSALFVGYAAANNTVIKDCSCEGTFTGVDDNCGGFCGNVPKNLTGVVFENCDAKVTMTFGASGSNVGGLIGSIQSGILVTGCDVEATINVAKSIDYVGGVVGYGAATSNNLLIEKCTFSGTIGKDRPTHNRSVYGGILSYAGGPGTVVRNCWSEGEIVGANHSVGGICGTLLKDTSVECCYSTMKINAGHGVGSIVGRANNHANETQTTQNVSYNNVVRKCIAWSPELTSTKNPLKTSNHSYGAVVGSSVPNNIFEDCYRKSDLTIVAYRDAKDIPYDQENTNLENALVWNYTGDYFCPYHGKAAASDATVSGLAKTLGWDQTVWDLSKDLPVLK